MWVRIDLPENCKIKTANLEWQLTRSESQTHTKCEWDAHFHQTTLASFVRANFEPELERASPCRKQFNISGCKITIIICVNDYIHKYATPYTPAALVVAMCLHTTPYHTIAHRHTTYLSSVYLEKTSPSSQRIRCSGSKFKIWHQCLRASGWWQTNGHFHFHEFSRRRFFRVAKTRFSPTVEPIIFRDDRDRDKKKHVLEFYQLRLF